MKNVTFAHDSQRGTASHALLPDPDPDPPLYHHRIRIDDNAYSLLLKEVVELDINTFKKKPENSR